MARPSRSTQKSTTSRTNKPRSVPKRSSRARRNEKSKHFETPSEDEDSSFDDATVDPTSESEPAPSESEEDEPPKKKKKSTSKKGIVKTTPQKRTGKGKSKKEEDEDEEPWETFVPKEATPDAGDVEYQNNTIHPNTLQFLKGIFLLRLIGR